MAHELIKLIKFDGDEIEPEWHVAAEFDVSRTLCGYALDGDAKYEAERKTVKRGGITCLKCLDVVRQIKSIKL